MRITGALFDTNACLYLLQAKVDPALEISNGLISVITEVELLGYPEITKKDELLISALIYRFRLAPIDERVRAAAIQMRRKYRLRLGDSLIVGTAVALGVSLVTHDKDLRRVKDIGIQALPLI